MYKVIIEGEEFKEVEFARCQSLDEAVALALGLHRSSNVEHVVKVYDVDHDNNAISFINRG